VFLCCLFSATLCYVGVCSGGVLLVTFCLAGGCCLLFGGLEVGVCSGGVAVGWV